MLPQEIIDVLESRLQDEYNNERFYKNASKWCDLNGWKCASDYFVCMMHKSHHLAHRLERYANDANTSIESPIVEQVSIVVNSYVDIIDMAYNNEVAYFNSYSENMEKCTNAAFEIFLEKYVKSHQKSVYNFLEMINKLSGISGNFELRQMQKKVFTRH